MAEGMRPFRLRGRGGPQKFGVAAGSLRGLLRKGCRLLQVPLAGSRLCLYEDGTELTESYFRVLPPQTELVLLGPGESWRGCECGGAGATGRGLGAGEGHFTGARSGRMRGNGYIIIIYYLQAEGPRWGEEQHAIHCSRLVFQGPFDRDDCPCKHSINPYSNRESRILFSTWNLDHVIEKKRAVVPELAEAVKTRDGREVNWEYFYQLLFTVHNLKLVHIACHKKTNHNLSCDKTKIYRKGKQNHKIS
ncbi:DFFB factor, partial [Cepphus grylle]|nr:DFFB factor [Cepphus grylle]